MKLYNTLTRNIETVTPLHGKKILFYSCGLTVYSQPHIGNWVGYIYWDVLQRALEADGYEVQRVQNITDVGHLVSDDDDGEDKMEKGAKREGITAWDVAEKYIAITDNEAFTQLKLKRPHIIRATDTIPQQIAFLEKLEALGFTYTIPNEGVYFDTSKFPSYGVLAQLDIDGLAAGARVAVTGKKNITDFALWKFSPTNSTRDMEWDSPWGTGFPGWHLECSVIAMEGLGSSIDIHAGGIDHIPVHHTNEIAQTEAVTGEQFSNYWVHNNHIKVDGAKMSKSLGNIYTLADITSRGYTLDAFKFTVLSKHYRTEGNFTWDILEASHNRMQSLYALFDLRWQPRQDAKQLEADYFERAYKAILEDVNNDLSTPQALAHLHEVTSPLERQGLHPQDTTEYGKFIENIVELFGLSYDTTDLPEATKNILQKRLDARAEKNWEKSDALRDVLKNEHAIVIKDSSATTQIWSRVY